MYKDKLMRNDTAKHIKEIRRILRDTDIDTVHPKQENTWILCLFIVVMVLFVGWLFCGCASAETIEGYNINKWAESIHKAEGNDNYGILSHYKHTTYKQACINTIRHKYRLWLESGRKGAFLAFLRAKYCPVGAFNDPHGLNKNWVRNVEYYLRKGA